MTPKPFPWSAFGIFAVVMALFLGVVAGCESFGIEQGDRPAPTTQQAEDAVKAGAGAAGLAAAVLLPPPYGELVAGIIGLSAGWYLRNRKGKTPETPRTE